jgi:hypothetical protein
MALRLPRAWRVCGETGCGEITPTGRCDQHRRTADRRRGTRQERGYDAAHDRLRKQWKEQVDQCDVDCWRCGKPINPLLPWDLGHDDNDKTKYKGPEHVLCNRGARPSASVIPPG